MIAPVASNDMVNKDRPKLHFPRPSEPGAAEALKASIAEATQRAIDDAAARDPRPTDGDEFVLGEWAAYGLTDEELKAWEGYYDDEL